MINLGLQKIIASVQADEMSDVEKQFAEANKDANEKEKQEKSDTDEKDTDNKEEDTDKEKNDKADDKNDDKDNKKEEEAPEENVESQEAPEQEELDTQPSPDDKPDKPTKSDIVKLLIKAVCDELTAAHQYMIAAHIARGPGYCDAIPEYLKHEQEEREHCNKTLKRLEQLNNKFKMDLAEIQEGGNKWEPIKTTKVPEQLDILIKAEKDAQRFYKKIINMTRDAEDWITNRLFKQLLADEAEHECDLKRIREQFEQEEKEEASVDDTAIEDITEDTNTDEGDKEAAKESLFSSFRFF